MRISLLLTNAGRAVLRHDLEGGLTTIGTNPECDLCIPDDAVAPVQALLRREGNVLTFEPRTVDGTLINDEQTSEATRLADGDVLHFGPVAATVRFVAQDDDGARGRTLTLAPESAPSLAAFVLTSPESFPGKRFPIDARGVNLGGDPTNDVVLDDPYVSSFHARVSLEGGRVMVRDLGSKNGLVVGERRLTAGEIAPGAQLKLGRTVFMVQIDGGAPRAEKPTGNRRLVGRTAVMDALRERVRRVASSDAPVLVTGETGTGKEVVARLIAELSPRAHKPFIALNCGALGKTLIESELFGHEKGAFTGALQRKAGAFEAAHGGTLFLDEIGELPLDLQPQLLRVLESGEVRRVGSTDAFKVDVRLVAATNRRLAHEVQRGSFREDLFHRLHVLMLELPSLRERSEDIPELARHFVADLSPAGENVGITNAAVEKLLRHEWPGNVRELRNVIQRAVLMRLGRDVDTDDVTFTPSTLSTRVVTSSATRQRTLLELEREAIVAELVRHGGSKTEAAVALGVSRSTIHRKIDEYQIDVDALLAAPKA